MATSQLLPSSQELEALAYAACMNSRQQLASAELLLERAHWPVAHALGTLALEEIGKSFLCMFASTNPEPFRGVFWKAFVSHTIKLQIAYAGLAPMAADTTSPPAHDGIEAILAFGQTAKTDHSTKMRGLYVDYTDGAVHDPADVTEQDAQTMVAHARTALDYLAPATTDGGLDPNLRAILAASAAHFTRLFDSPDTDIEDHLQQLWNQVVAGVVEPPSWIRLTSRPVHRRAPGLDHRHRARVVPLSSDRRRVWPRWIGPARRTRGRDQLRQLCALPAQLGNRTGPPSGAWSTRVIVRR